MRTGVVIVSHGDSGQAMVTAAEKMVGSLATGVVTVPIGEPKETTAQHIEQACERLSADELLFLVDLEGSTPFNVCSRRHGRCWVLTGVNMPMLFKLATVDRDRPAQIVAEELAATGQKSIHIRAGSGCGDRES